MVKNLRSIGAQKISSATRVRQAGAAIGKEMAERLEHNVFALPPEALLLFFRAPHRPDQLTTYLASGIDPAVFLQKLACACASCVVLLALGNITGVTQ